MSTANNNISILPWYDSKSRQNHRKSYAYGQVFPLHCELYKLPPFQVYRTTNLGDPITSFKLIRIETGTETEVVTSIVNDGGLNVQSFSPPDVADAYDLIVYPGLDPLTDVGSLPEGMYEAEMTDGTTTWYSERFFMRNSVSEFIKLSYWHNTPFRVPLHHISYTDPFYNFIYLNTEINRPEYVEEEEVEKRDGYRFAIYQTSYKNYRIVGLAVPEYMTDALRLVWMHHNVVIEHEGIEYVTDSCRVIFNGWVSQGHLMGITIEFTTDTVVIQTGFVEDEGYGGDYDQGDYNDDHLIE